MPKRKSRRKQTPSRPMATLQKNLESLGFLLSSDLIDVVYTLNPPELNAFYSELIKDLLFITGGSKKFEPMYPNFPNQVMSMSSAELYLNAIHHYWTLELPEYEKEERPPLEESSALAAKNLKVIGLGSYEDLEALFTIIASSTQPWSPLDKDDIQCFVDQYRDEIGSLLPETFPCKENLAFVTSLLLRQTDLGDEMVPFFKTATDVLRLAVALSDGDVSLAEPCKFGKFTRKERSLLLSMIENVASPGDANGIASLKDVDNNPLDGVAVASFEGLDNRVAEDMNRWKQRWIRLGEKLHPGDYAKRYPRAFEAFDIIRNDKPIETFNRKIEGLIGEKKLPELVELLQKRPGEFARRLDHLIRLEGEYDEVVSAFNTVVEDVSTNVLLQVMNHFRYRGAPSDLRVFFPKGSVGKLFATKSHLPEIALDGSIAIVKLCEDTLIRRFATLPALGNCFLDERLKKYLAPFALRSASKSLRTLVRGSRVPVPYCSTLRMFIWWKNGNGRVDLDLSAAMYDSECNYLDSISYQNLKNYGAVHSGDITDAPDGAAEFIDVDVQKCLQRNVRYIVTSLNSYTEQPYCDLPECFAGWRARDKPGSGEVFGPRTLIDKIDVAADTRCCLPAIFDIVANEMIWADIALLSNPRFPNNVKNNLCGVSLMLRALLNLRKTNLFELFLLHIGGRGNLVDSVDDADTVFSVDEGITPFDLEIISADFMG